MADIFPLRLSEHENVQQLLPWYVNGTLSRDEAEHVESHLQNCVECSDVLEFDRKLARDVPTLPVDLDASWKAMHQRLQDRRPGNVIQGRFGFLNRSIPMRWAASGSLAAAVAAAFVVTTFQPGTVPEKTYRALGSAPAAADGEVVVLFKPDTTEQQMRIILSAQGARVVDGPTAAGAYVLRIEDRSAGAAIASLRQSSQVVLAESIASDGRR